MEAQDETASRLSLLNVSSADLLGERNEDALRATDITEPIAVLVLHQLANQFGTVGAEPGNDIIDVLDGKHDATYAQVLGGALFGSALVSRRPPELRQLNGSDGSGKAAAERIDYRGVRNVLAALAPEERALLRRADLPDHV